MPTTPNHLIPWPLEPAWGLPRRFYDGRNFRQDNRDQWAEGGYFVDYETDEARRFVYEVRTLVRPQPTIRQIAEHYGFQHKLNAYSAYNTWQRRLHGSTPAATLRPDDCRSFTRRRRQADGTVTTEAMFGIEIEFLLAGHVHQTTARHAIIADLCAAGFAAHNCWQTHNTDASLGGWQGMYDGSISHGGELVSPPLPANDEGFAQLSTAMAIVRRHGGTAAAHQGLHTNIGTGDLSDADLARLARNIYAVQPHMLAFMPPTRRSSQWCRPVDSYTTETLAAELGAGRRPTLTRYTFANFANATSHTSRGARRVEFRGMGHTLNMRKLRPWVRFCLALVAASHAGVVFTPGVTLDMTLAMLAEHGMTAWSSDAFRDRVRRNTLANAA